MTHVSGSEKTGTFSVSECKFCLCRVSAGSCFVRQRQKYSQVLMKICCVLEIQKVKINTRGKGRLFLHFKTTVPAASDWNHRFQSWDVMLCSCSETWLGAGLTADVVGASGANGSCVSELCSFLLHAAHDELCDGKMLLRENERQRGLLACDEAATLRQNGAKSESQRGGFN